MKPRDMYGQIIEAGDYISYPFNHSSGARSRTAKVLDTRKRKDHLDRDIDVLTVMAIVDGEKKKITLRRPDNCIVIPKLYIQNHSEYSRLIHM